MRIPLKVAVARAIAKHRRTHVVRLLARCSRGILRAYENDNSDLDSNGEAALLSAIPSGELRVVFDVGAHHGRWTRLVLDRHPDARIFAFEIESANRERLRSAVGADGRVKVMPFGLGSARRVVDVRIDDRHPEMISILGSSGRVQACAVEAGDDTIDEHRIDEVDLLKLDVEGAERDVLAGFSRSLAAERIGAIQFEFTLWAAIGRSWLKDFYDLLEPAGFRIGKIYPTYVDLRAYAPSDEIFVRANFLAVHRSRSRMLAALEATAS